MPILHFTLVTQDTTETITYPVDNVVIAGWAARDIDAVEHHIKELEAIGVPRPSSVPLFYRVSAELATQDTDVQMLGADSSGEIEPVVFTYRGETWLSIGSDHTDRKVESYSVAVSKQMCAKPVARHAWRLAEVVDRWDALVVRAFIEEDGKRVLYQEGPLAKMRTPADLIGRYAGGAKLLPEGTLMTCGTVAAIGGVRPSTTFAMELEDSVAGRTLRHEYRSGVLPVVA